MPSQRKSQDTWVTSSLHDGVLPPRLSDRSGKLNTTSSDLPSVKSKPSEPQTPKSTESSCDGFRSLLSPPLLEDKPLLRGKIHLALIYTAPLWIYQLCRRCQSTRSMASAIIVILSAMVNFGCSALLHNVNWSTGRARTFWRRLDHAGIFLMIAGSCAPIPMLLFSTRMSVVWAVFQWSATLVGIGMCMGSKSFSISDQYGTRATVYAIVGLSNALFAVEFSRVLSLAENTLLVLMAASYVIGACFYGCKWPNVWPGVMGYHEVFHLMCLAAAIFTFALDYKVLGRIKTAEGLRY